MRVLYKTRQRIVLCLVFYAHADAEGICHCMVHRRRASREEETSLLDCADPCRGNMSVHGAGVKSNIKMRLKNEIANKYTMIYNQYRKV